MGIVDLVNALLGLMTPQILFSVLWATFLGIVVGMLPGLTATMGIALLTGLTFQWESANAIVILIGMYVGAIYGGLSMIPALVGVYGMTEVIQTTVEAQRRGRIVQVRRVLPRIRDLIQNRKNIIRSGLIGTFVGTIPGVGENIASFVAYDFARRGSKTPEKFGTGVVEGLAAAETGDNACVGGAIIPVLVLAVPGSPPAAVLLAAMWLHGMRPGPLLVIEAPNYIYEVSAMFFLASLAMLILGPMLDENLRRGLILYKGSLIPFFSRPICIILIIFILMTLFSRSTILKRTMQSLKQSITAMFQKKT